MTNYRHPLLGPDTDTRFVGVLKRAAIYGINIPQTVPSHLRAEFADCALAHGIDRARRHIARRTLEKPQ